MPIHRAAAEDATLNVTRCCLDGRLTSAVRGFQFTFRIRGCCCRETCLRRSPAPPRSYAQHHAEASDQQKEDDDSGATGDSPGDCDEYVHAFRPAGGLKLCNLLIHKKCREWRTDRQQAEYDPLQTVTERLPAAPSADAGVSRERVFTHSNQA